MSAENNVSNGMWYLVCGPLVSRLHERRTELAITDSPHMPHISWPKHQLCACRYYGLHHGGRSPPGPTGVEQVHLNPLVNCSISSYFYSHLGIHIIWV